VQGRAFDLTSLTESLIIACGCKLSSAYFEMLDMDVSDVLYHLERFRRVQELKYPDKTSSGKLQSWGFSDDDFEEI
jgi:hypothetical protein